MTDPSDQDVQADQPDQDPYGQSGYPYDPYQQTGYPYYGYQDAMYGQGGAPRQHTRIGIASFIVGLISMTVAISAMIIATVIGLRNPELSQLQPGDLQAPELIGTLMAVAIPVCVSVISGLIGLILGILALMQTGYKKVLPIIGTVLNGLILAGCLLQIVLGLIMGLQNI